MAGDNSSVVVCVPAPEGMIYPALRLKRGDECAALARRYDGGGLLYGVIFKLRLLITQVPSPEARVKEFCVWWTRRRGTKIHRVGVWDRGRVPLAPGWLFPGSESLFPFCHSSTLYGIVRGGVAFLIPVP